MRAARARHSKTPLKAAARVRKKPKTTLTTSSAHRLQALVLSLHRDHALLGFEAGAAAALAEVARSPVLVHIPHLDLELFELRLRGNGLPLLRSTLAGPRLLHPDAGLEREEEEETEAATQDLRKEAR